MALPSGDQIISFPASVQVVVFGYTGYENTGDELLLSALRQGIAETGVPVELTVLTRDPMATRRIHGVRTLEHPPFGGAQRPALGTRWKRMRALFEADLVILGPGGFFQDYDVHGVRAMFGTLRVALTARLGGGRVIAMGLGAGPLIRPWGRRLTRWIASLCDELYARDNDSVELLRSLGAPGKKLIETADLAFHLTPPEASERGEGTKTLGVSVFDFHGYIEGTSERAESERRAWAAALDTVTEQGIRIRFFTMQGAFGGRDEDEARRIRGLMKRHDAVEVLPYMEKAEDTWREIARCTWFVGMRYHGIVMAVSAGVPCAAVSYHPKVTTLMGVLGLGEYAVPLDALTEERLERVIQRLMSLDAVPGPALHALEELRDQAGRNFSAFRDYAARRFGAALPTHSRHAP